MCIPAPHETHFRAENPLQTPALPRYACVVARALPRLEELAAFPRRTPTA